MADADVIVVGAGLAGLVAACELVERGPSGADRRPGERRQPRRAGVLVVRRPVLRRQPRTAPAGHPRQPRAGAAGLARHRGVRPARGPLAAAMGTRLRRFRRGGEAQLAAGARAADLPAGRLGRARRLRRTRTRQLGAALPHHLGDRARDRRDLRAPAAGNRRRCASRTATGRRADRRGRRGGRGARARCWSRRPRARGVASSRNTVGRVRVPRPGGDRHQRRHRRQPRPGAAELAASGWAGCPSSCSAGCPPTSTAG